MSAASELLHASARRIASSAAEVQDSEALVFAVQHAAESVADCIDSGQQFDISELARCLDDSALARILRGLQSEAIELFRRELPEAECIDAIGALRTVLHQVIPRPPVDHAERDFYRRLLERDCQDLDDDHCRMLALFQDLSFSLNDILYVHDLNGTFLYINEPGLKLTQFTMQDLLDGVSIYDIIVPEFVDLIEARLESPGAVSRAPYTSEIYTKFGERVPCEISSRCIVRNGHISGIIGIARDLRLARRLETEIARLNACMDSLLRGLSCAVLFADINGVIQDANTSAAGMFGSPSPAALIGMPLSVACNEVRPVLHEMLAESMCGDRETRLHYSGVSRFGAELDCDLAIVPVRTTDGGSLFIIILTDLSGNQIIAQTRVQAEKLDSLEEIIGKMAHEMNNPLTGIVGYAQLLLNSKLEPATRARVEHVAAEAERCRKLVQNLFAFSTHDDNKKTPQDLNEIVGDALSLREYQFHVDEIVVHTALQPGLPHVLAEPNDLQRVCLSFLMNAEQALNAADSQQKVLTVRTYTKDKCVCLEFEDNGPGIPKCIQSKIFDPFFTTKGVGGGAGLGLSVAYGMIRSHGGSIALESDEGAGAKFTITLPSGGTF